jgi:type IV pilus assembly protein PilB
MLSVLNTTSANIATIEDTIKYRINGVNQTQVDPAHGMTFVSGLQAVLRQDPNIVMVSEVRNHVTADLMTQASLSGHLVFGGLHAPTTTTCLARLADMGLEPFLIASCVRVVVAQRLVRKLCVHCREHVTPDQATLKHIAHSFHLEENGGLKKLHELETEAFAEGVGKTATRHPSEISTSATAIQQVWKARKDGCTNCGHSGYKGRIGLFEVLDMSDTLQRLIVGKKAVSKIEQTAVHEGMVTMKTDGLIKALRGLTTIDEILRVISS